MVQPVLFLAFSRRFFLVFDRCCWRCRLLLGIVTLLLDQAAEDGEL